MNYQRFFKLHKRVSGKSKIAIVRPDLINEFVAELVVDQELDLSYKVFLIASLSGGLRVNEALSLKKNDFLFEDGELYFDVQVLKKRNKADRLAKVHPLAVNLVRSYLDTAVGKLFKFCDTTALNRIKKLSGYDEACSHALRHTMVSYLLFERNLTHFKAARVLNVGVKAMEAYAHSDSRRLLKEVF